MAMPLDALFDFPKFPEAQCAKLDDLDFFFPDSQIQLEDRWPRILELCGRCIHKEECLDYAVKNQIFDGIWAATTGSQRALISLPKEDRRNRRFREIQSLLATGFTKEQIAVKLGIQMASVDRTLDRAKRKGIL